jgi:hypothetical protein
MEMIGMMVFTQLKNKSFFVNKMLPAVFDLLSCSLRKLHATRHEVRTDSIAAVENPLLECPLWSGLMQSAMYWTHTVLLIGGAMPD